METILVTGGLGYIGSHVCIELIEQGKTPVIIDNLSNTDADVLNNIHAITGKTPLFYEADIRDRETMSQIIRDHNIECVMHFAGLKAVGESVQKPILYYQNNVEGTLHLLQAMEENNCRSIIFSSSATVYGTPDTLPMTEDMPTGRVANPYGRTKYIIEEILQDLYASDNRWSATILRYFNPVGAHPSGLIGENPKGIPNNLMPYIAKVATGEYPHLSVFGNDYNTPDGTGVRDYIHVVDLAQGHIAALNHCAVQSGIHIYNLGTGHGNSVLEVLKAYETACKKQIHYCVEPRRDGDIASSWACPEKARTDLQWCATKTLDDMACDSWRWIQNISSQSTHTDKS
jgi:UDP-glucose 4-epimerase